MQKVNGTPRTGGWQNCLVEKFVDKGKIEMDSSSSNEHGIEAEDCISQPEAGGKYETACSAETNTLEQLTNLAESDSELEAKGRREKPEGKPREYPSPTVSSDDYEDAQSNVTPTLSSISSANLSDDVSFRESPPDALENTVPVRKKNLHFLLADYMLDMVVQTEAFLGYQELMKNLVCRICSLRKKSDRQWGVYSSEEVYCFVAHCLYEEMTEVALKEMRAQQQQWLLLVNLIPENELEEITPSQLYERLVKRFTQVQLDELGEVIPPKNPTEVLYQLIFRPGQHPSSAAFAAIIRWQPFSSDWSAGYFEGYGEGCGETNEESKRISYDKACRDILKQICTKFSDFVETLRRGETAHVSGFEDQICFILFQYVCPNTLEYSTQNPCLRFNLRKMSIFSQPISRNAMRVTTEYLKDCGAHIPLAKMNAGAENWIPSDHRARSRITTRLVPSKENDVNSDNKNVDRCGT